MSRVRCAATACLEQKTCSHISSLEQIAHPCLYGNGDNTIFFFKSKYYRKYKLKVRNKIKIETVCTGEKMVSRLSCVHCRSLLRGLDCDLSEHELLVLGRSFTESRCPEEDVGTMLATAQELLRKKLFEHFHEIKRALVHRDRSRYDTHGRIYTLSSSSNCMKFKCWQLSPLALLASGMTSRSTSWPSVKSCLLVNFNDLSF